jgi:hypothetical protein
MVGLQTLHSTLQTRPKAVCAKQSQFGNAGTRMDGTVRGRAPKRDASRLGTLRTLQARKTNPIPASRDTPEAPGKSVGIGGTVR